MAVHEPPSDEAFAAGVQAGVTRARRYGLEPRSESFRRLAADAVGPPDALPEPLAVASSRMKGDGASARFAELFAELVTVAVVARHAYGDEPLQAGQVEEYLDHSYAILNSFRHA